jgi:hypothetical protein
MVSHCSAQQILRHYRHCFANGFERCDGNARRTISCTPRECYELIRSSVLLAFAYKSLHSRLALSHGCEALPPICSTSARVAAK